MCSSDLPFNPQRDDPGEIEASPGSFKLVGLERFELSASATRKQRSTRLSHSPTRNISIDQSGGMISNQIRGKNAGGRFDIGPIAPRVGRI